MNILEIPIIGSRKSGKENFFSLLSEQPLRKFEGLDVGYLNLNDEYSIYFYFLDQENEDYFYLWDLIIPYAIGCIIVCDPDNTEIFEKNVETIDRLKKLFKTPLHICSFPTKGEDVAFLEQTEALEEEKEFLYFNPEDKNSAKTILQHVLDIASKE